MDTSSVASGQTSNHLKWSNLDLFFRKAAERRPREIPFPILKPYESNGTDQLIVVRTGRARSPFILDGEFDPGSG